ncbi:MAG: hypothetical protein K0R73_505 [Candidatus Midichloriaceae bacterium]|jgi:hypothetical protein|nr:hypothetical protein [Candidatus Midichloriaceae bacterium]
MGLHYLIIFLLLSVTFEPLALDVQEGETSIDPSFVDKELGQEDKGIFGGFFSRESHEDEPAGVEHNLEIMVQEQDKAIATKDAAMVRVIDKTLGKLYLLDIGIGSKKTVNEIIIKVNSCLQSNQKLVIPEGRALVEIFEVRSRVIERIFNGWLYMQSASVSQLSHPKYDITLAGCVNANAQKLQN